MRLGYNVSEADGRFLWTIIMYNDLMSGGKMIMAPIKFDSAAEAEADVDRYINGKRDDSGRVILSRDEVDALLNSAKSACEDCANITLAPSSWHERDETGANWEIRSARGPDWDSCRFCLDSDVANLRAAYSIPDER